MTTPLIINVGTIPDDGTGNILRDAFIKTNDNFNTVFSNVDTINTRINDILETPQEARIKALEDNELTIKNDINIIKRDIGAVKYSERGSLQAQIDKLYTQLSYVPTSILSFLINGVTAYQVDNGTSVTNITFNWSLSGPVPNRQALINLSTQDEIIIQPGTLSYTLPGPITSIPNNTKTEYSWTLNLISVNPLGQSIALLGTVTLRFLPRVFYGVSIKENISGDDFQYLTNSVLSDTRPRTSLYNASGGKYLYYAYPQTFDRIEAVSINGLYFSDYSSYQVQYTSPNNTVLPYYVYKINPLQHGNYIKVDWL